MHSSRYALGTAQFGLPYGVANKRGQVSCDEVAAILNRAWASGIDSLDTAIAYGESEQRLGDIGVRQWRVVTKLPALPSSCDDVSSWAHQAVMGSLARLKIDRLCGLLLHRPTQLLGPQGAVLQTALLALKNQGLVEKIGISIYDPAELDAVWPSFQPDMVQAPLNVLDRRLRTSGWLRRMHNAGTEVHIRSVFLQGLLLMNDASRPARFNRWQPLWDLWHRWLTDKALSPLQACIGFALSQSEVARVVVGVDSLAQFEEILGMIHKPILDLPPELVCVDPALVDPSRWELQ